MLSHVWLFVTPWTVARQALLSMGFSWQEYFSGLPFHSLGNLPDPGIEPRSPTLQADSLLSEPLTVQRIDLIYTTNCGKFLKRWEYQITLPVSWETCMWVKKQHLELYLEQLTRSKLEKSVTRLYIVTLLILFALYAEYIIGNARLDESQTGIKNVWRNIINLSMVN